MSDHSIDPWLDDQLRDLPLPAGLLERLKAGLAPSDEQLDDGLRAVGIPGSVLLRLHEIPADAAVDEALVAVAAPLELIHGLRKPTATVRLRRFGRQVARLTLAATLFVAISVALAAGGGVVLTGVMPVTDGLDMVFIYDEPLSIYSQAHQEPEVVFASAEESVIEPGSVAAVLSSPEQAFDQPITRIGQPDIDGLPMPGPVAQFVSLVNSGLRPMDDAVLLRWGVLGSPHYADDDSPDLAVPQLPRAVGIEPPISRGYDRLFFLKHRVFPPLSPAADPRLAELRVPLITTSDAFARLEQAAAQDRSPHEQDIRVEALIAAMDYHLSAAPPGKLAIRTAAGPSPFALNDAGVLLVGVQAGRLASRPQAATHLVLAIDFSHSMTHGGRLEMLRTAIRRTIDQLQPRDRISLVVFNEDVVQVVEGASAADAGSLNQLLGELSPRGGTNLAAGLQQAASLAMTDAAEPTAARRLVLITDSQATLLADTESAIEEVLVAAGDTGVRLDVLDLSHREAADPLFERWSHLLAGEVRQIQDTRGLTLSLVESLSGCEPTIARDTRLTLRFNPQTVAAYRLVGHEANAVADLTPSAVEAEFAAGESAEALVELWFAPGDADDLGHAELSWVDPGTGKSHTIRQRLSRLQFAPTLAESPASLVKATLAAEVAETLRGSHEALRLAGVRPAGRRSLASVLEASQQANPRLLDEPDFQRLMELTRRLQRQGMK